MVWKYEKFKGDVAIYAFCPKCNFRHIPSKLEFETMKAYIAYQYNYCPVCGEYLYDEKAETNGFEIIWNERDIIELYQD